MKIKNEKNYKKIVKKDIFYIYLYNIKIKFII